LNNLIRTVLEEIWFFTEEVPNLGKEANCPALSIQRVIVRWSANWQYPHTRVLSKWRGCAHL